MRGHVRKRGRTSTVAVDTGLGETGRRKQQWRGGFATRRDAEHALAEAIRRDSGRALGCDDYGSHCLRRAFYSQQGAKGCLRRRTGGRVADDRCGKTTSSFGGSEALPGDSSA